MSTRIILVFGIILAAVCATAQNTAELKSPKDRHSYAVGLDLGNQMRKLSLGADDLDPALIAKGVMDAISGGKTLMTDEELRASIADLQAEVKKRRLLPPASGAGSNLNAEKNSREGEAFLAENRMKAGVVTLPSGLQYKILKAGEGRKPVLGDMVVCHYRGTLIDGTEFDSSYKSNQPATFAVTGVIKGWTEALQLMPVGSKWQLFIPSGLAYAERGKGSLIGPNAALIFEVELLAIK